MASQFVTNFEASMMVRMRIVRLGLDGSSLRTFTFLPKKPTLVITSPPYPGVHVRYHRWTINQRVETPAPFWIADCKDGQGAAYYTLGDRRQLALDSYFQGPRPRAGQRGQKSEDEGEANIERRVAEFTRAVAPILLSMIESLGNLDGEPVPTLAG